MGWTLYYKRYIQAKDYSQEIFEEMGKDKVSNDINKHEGANQMLRSLVVNHRDEYEQIGKEIGLSYGVLDIVSLVAWAEDARLKDWQMIQSPRK